MYGTRDGTGVQAGRRTPFKDLMGLYNKCIQQQQHTHICATTRLLHTHNHRLMRLLLTYMLTFASNTAAVRSALRHYLKLQSFPALCNTKLRAIYRMLLGRLHIAWRSNCSSSLLTAHLHVSRGLSAAWQQAHQDPRVSRGRRFPERLCQEQLC